MNKTIITIGRQFGSGGREVAKKLAGELNIPYYDKELLAVAAQESGLAPQFLEEMDEKKPAGLLYSLVMGPRNLIWNDYNTSVDYMASQAQREAIIRVAGQGSCIIVGRCADYILREEAGLSRIFICADEEDRIKRIMARDQVTEAQARDKMRRMDKSRAAYYDFNTEHRWGEASNYDLCINVSRHGRDAAVKLIMQFVNTP